MRFSSRMFTCLKCGKKIKTLYERVFGERSHYEPSGYRCDTCHIFYDAETKQTSRMVSGVAKKDQDGVRSTVAVLQQERMQTLHKPNAVLSQTACENLQSQKARSLSSAHETTWMGRDSNSRPPVCETGILTRLDYPSKNECPSSVKI